MATSAWPFPKEHYHPKAILMDIQDLLNPQHLNPCSLKENLSQLEHELSLCPSGIRMSGMEPSWCLLPAMSSSSPCCVRADQRNRGVPVIPTLEGHL